MKKIFICFFAFSIFFSLSAKDIRVSKVIAPVYESADAKRPVGKLLPTNEFEVLEKKDGRLKISLKGYQNPKAKSALYFVSGKRILVLGLSKNASLKPKKLGSKDGWDELSYTLYIKDEGTTKDILGFNKKLENLFENRCSMCHSLHRPAEVVANQWPSIINAMKSRAGLSKNEQFGMALWLQKQAKDMPKGE